MYNVYIIFYSNIILNMLSFYNICIVSSNVRNVERYLVPEIVKQIPNRVPYDIDRNMKIYEARRGVKYENCYHLPRAYAQRDNSVIWPLFSAVNDGRFIVRAYILVTTRVIV